MEHGAEPDRRPRRASYYLYPWQIRHIQRLARETGRPPSEVLREVLTRALGEG
ncbi:protein of unknown function [Candidatus Hydrogenisulfobacillus filiaventi]|uniref:Ribbon-helix-helix protein CopG domain-containing protein n=1 Tax=Candidatus Hydrogenisulfobacillus filiaventi TaxID=2707344 RepID=A0A6F8ZEH1_9FIRM|nr:protein of unknown function [Candidatus Hydrogenisulfobacillus filiaventi]